MTEMIEIVARVVAAFEPCRGNDGVMCENDCRCKAIARAAIEAMSEPTDMMLAYGESFMDFILPDAVGENTPDGRRAEFKIGYKVAMDVALGKRR